MPDKHNTQITMKLQDTLFTIRKISYPNSNTRHGKCKINLIAQQGEDGDAAMNSAINEAFLLQMTKEKWSTLTKEEYKELFRHSAVERCKYEQLTRNIAALGTNDKTGSQQ